MEDHLSKVSEEVDMSYDMATDEEIRSDVSSPNKYVDCTKAFTTTEVFSTRDALLNWARAVAFDLGFVVVILRSDTGHKGRKIFVVLGCERSGKYKPYKDELVRKVTGSRKCKCPFRLRGRPLKNGEGWKINVVSGYHNHELAKTLVGHPYAGRLKGEEKSLLDDMTKNMVKPRNILLTLKDHNEDNVTTIKQIYNARAAFRASQKSIRIEMQRLINLLERDQYVYWHRRVEMSDVVRDIFWTHPDAIKLLNAFNIVLLIDNTYKTNRYRLPLFEIVGVTSTELTFSVAFVYVESERVDNFTWALRMLRGLFLRDDFLPQVIVTDKDTALMNAVQVVFPTAANLLCQFHIAKNVKAKCKMIVHPTEEWELVMAAWGSILDSRNEAEYTERLTKFESICSSWPIFVNYVNNTWLIPHKEKFVLAWIDQVMHLGNTITNRVEYARSMLKKLLQDSRGDLCNSWDAMNNMIILQHTEIRASFEESINVVGHRFNINLYNRLRGFVSRSALTLIADEYDRVKNVGVDSSICGCTVRTTHGLPCACELAKYTIVPLEVVHTYWRRLNFGDQGMNEPWSELSLEHELNVIAKRFEKLDVAGKIALKTKLRELAYPDTTSMCSHPEKVRTKVAQKGHATKLTRSTKRDPSYFEHVDAQLSVHDSTSTCRSSQTSSHETKRNRKMSMLDHFPVWFHPYIEDIVDVKPDGNCGYRAIAALLGKGEDSWALVRQDLIKELGEWHDEYANLFGSHERVAELKQSLYVQKQGTYDKWMTIPDMGYVIASKYNVVLVSLSLQGSMTFFPLRRPPPSSQSAHRIISIGFVYDNHFVQVFLKPGSPIPPTALLWSRHCHLAAASWITPYVSRMQQFRSFIEKREPNYVDITKD